MYHLFKSSIFTLADTIRRNAIDDKLEMVQHTNSFYSPKQSNMSPTATPNSTTLQGAWPATSMYRPSRFRFPMAHPAAYGSYTASSSGSRTPEWPGQVGNS
ncbi:hypothetical protein CHS0354_031465 [Potamilus streckersoni]|uniref:Uncharacterized protein n=1 Tax=Potamilus streckersoni TaxID=2493646 RepID=A0AAE0SHA3_9BIVA|nr:hypothetical protein CHS0354_031465 [Potamilus streckersoni]